MELNKLYTEIKEYLYLEDEKLIDCILAIALSREQKHTKLWLIIIGRSGDGKSELLELIDDNGKKTKLVRQLTSRTLVNGHQRKSRYPDLAPKLKDKIMLMPEMACILTATKEEKANIWAQLRNLYEGKAGKQSGDGLDIDYINLNVSFIGCSTPDIDKQVLLNQSLGTRELLYRCNEKDDSLLMDRIITNSSINKEEHRIKLRKLIQDFLNKKKYENIVIPEEVEKELRNWAIVGTKLRATANIDYSTGELYNFMYPEAPTRILEQLIVFYRALKSLDKNYTDKRALEVIQKIVLSSCDPVRMEIVKFLIKNNMLNSDRGFSKRDVAKEVDISPKKAFAELNILSSKRIGLVNKEVRIDEDRDLSYYKYKINEEDETIEHLAKCWGVSDYLKLNITTEKVC